MANIKDLKKDINWLSYEVISDCLIFKHIHKKESEDEVNEIMQHMIDKRDEFIRRINTAKRTENKKAARAEYKKVLDELMKTADDSFKKLSELAK